MLVSSPDRSLGTMMGAPDRLQQVVWNLVMNAVKFTPQGGRVDVSVQQRSRTVDIVVKDTGQGITSDLLPHVFEPFRQGDSSTTRAHGGLGLGLALVRQLLALARRPRARRECGQGLRIDVHRHVAFSWPRHAERCRRCCKQGRPRRAERGPPCRAYACSSLTTIPSPSTCSAMVLRLWAPKCVPRRNVRRRSGDPDLATHRGADRPRDARGRRVHALSIDAETTFAERGVTVPIVALTAFGTTEETHAPPPGGIRSPPDEADRSAATDERRGRAAPGLARSG